MEKELGKNKFNSSCFSTWVVVKLALLLTKSRNGSWTDDSEAASESSVFCAGLVRSYCYYSSTDSLGV